MENNKKTPVIGVVTAKITDHSQKQQLIGILDAAVSLGVNVVVISNIYNCFSYFADVDIENKIYDLINSKKLDGLILNGEAILNNDLKKDIFNKLISRNDVPVIVTGNNIPEFEYIDNDVSVDTEILIDHLIDEHGFTNIDFITGYSYIQTSVDRVKGYRKSLEKHGIQYDENKVIYGDYWTISGVNLAKEYISGTRRLPQAIACANDFMGFGILDTFINSGISVPDDVSVIAYEYSNERYLHYPVLTSYLRNREAVGAKALITLYNKITGSNHPMPSAEGKLLHGSSCPCCTNMKFYNQELSLIRREQFYSGMNYEGNFEQQLTTCHSLDDYIKTLREFNYLIRDVNGLYLCLYDNWCSSSAKDSNLMMCCSIKTPSFTNPDTVFFRKNELYPESVIYDTKNVFLYFCPVFYAGRDFGYFILQYDHSDTYDKIFREWLKIASNALEYLRLKNDIHTLIECSNLSTHHDAETGFYNADGIRSELEFISNTIDNTTSVGMALVQMGWSNDFSGLDDAETESKIRKEITNILSSVDENGLYCVRLENNLYALIIVGNEDSMDTIVDKIYVKLLHLYLRYGKVSGFPIIKYLSSCKRDFSFDSALAELSKKVAKESDEHSKATANPNFNGYLDIRLEIWKNPKDEYSTDDLCRRFSHSEAYFRNTYKELFGISFRQDVIRSRIHHAKYLLLTTQMSLTAIAEKCGYDDEKYFFRRFKALTDMTPNQYKVN